MEGNTQDGGVGQGWPEYHSDLIVGERRQRPGGKLGSVLGAHLVDLGETGEEVLCSRVAGAGYPRRRAGARVPERHPGQLHPHRVQAGVSHRGHRQRGTLPRLVAKATEIDGRTGRPDPAALRQQTRGHNRFARRLAGGDVGACQTWRADRLIGLEQGFQVYQYRVFTRRDQVLGVDVASTEHVEERQKRPLAPVETAPGRLVGQGDAATNSIQP